MDDGFKNRSHWLAGELAKAAGVSRDTLRHYERKGVLARPRRAVNGYRLYPESALTRVLLVRRALSVGFTLDELARILSEREKGGAPCRKVRSLVAEKLSAIEDRLEALNALRDDLQTTLADWDERLEAASPDSRIGLLETLIENDRSSNETLKNPSSKPKFQRRKKKK